MKISQQPSTKVFQPVTFQFTFETQEELDAFGKLMNFAPICDVLRDIGCDIGSVHHVFSNAGSEITNTDTIRDRLMKTHHMAARYTNK